MSSLLVKIVTMMLTLNSERWLNKGVLTALKEAAEGYDHHLLVVDGGSTDGTVEAVRATFGDRAIILHCPERNLAVCRNFALDHAPTGADFYCWVDSDIVVPKNFFQRLIPLFDDPSVGTAELTARLEGGGLGSVAGYYKELKSADERGVKVASGGATVCLIMRPELARAIRMDGRLRRAGEDVSLHHQVTERGYKAVVDLDEPVARHIRTPSLQEEVRRLIYRGMARALNLKLHQKVIGGSIIRATLSGLVTIAAWFLLVYGLISAAIWAFIPLPILLVRQAAKLKRPWKIHLAMVGLLLSTVYLVGLLYGFFKYWVFNL
ncbi:MAG: glycosyltransferase [Candidatus Bathyarchaeia archaeon]